MRLISSLFLFSLLFAACYPNNTPAPGFAILPTYRQAAEFEPTEAVWLLWSQYEHKRGFSNAQATFDILHALLPYTNVRLVVPNDSIRQVIESQLDKTIFQNSKLQIFTLPYREFWARDMGPAFLKRSDGQLAIADFNFSGWGYSTPDDPAVQPDEQLDQNIAAQLGLPIVASHLITEGGDHEVNGKGLLIACETVEKTRNPHLTLPEIEAELRRVLGVSKIIWMKKGLFEDDHTHLGPLPGDIYTVITTNGHVDEFVRFVDENTVLLAEVEGSENDPVSAENRRRLDENLHILQQARDQRGQALRIIRMPLPQAIISTMSPGDGVYDIISEMHYAPDHPFPQGQTVKVIAAASYLNFLIANDCVLMPRYWQKGLPGAIRERDEQAQSILQSVFPNKKIIPLDVLSVNWGGGGIHCITRNQPKR
jgi:agmatine deiminase